MNWGNFWKTVHHLSVAIGTYAGMGSIVPYPPVQIAAGVIAGIASVIAHATQ